RWVGGNPFFRDANGFSGVDGGQNDGRILVRLEKLRIERGSRIEQRRQQRQIERSQIIELRMLSRLENLSADVLQRPHPVPISHQSIETQTETLCGAAVEVEPLVGRAGAWCGTMRVHLARQYDHTRESEDHYCTQQQVRYWWSSLFRILFDRRRTHLKLRR